MRIITNERVMELIKEYNSNIKDRGLPPMNKTEEDIFTAGLIIGQSEALLYVHKSLQSINKKMEGKTDEIKKC